MRAALVASMFVVSVVSSASAQYGATRVQTAYYAYDVPPGWQPRPASGVEHMHASPSAPGRTINITTEAFVGSPADYLQASLTGLRGQRQVTIRATRPTNVGSLPGFEIESDWYENGVAVHLLQIGTAYDGRGFVLTCGDLVQSFAAAEPECRAIFRTFVVGPDVAAAGGQRVEGPGYRYVVPAGWREESGSSVRSHASTTSPGRSVNLNMEPWNGNVPGYRDASLVGLRQEPHVRIIQVRDAMVGSLPGFEIDALWMEDGMTLHLLQLGTAHNGRGYVLTCGDLEQNFQSAVAECRRILATFTVGGGAPAQTQTPVTGPSPSYGTSPERVQQNLRAAVDARGAELAECQAAALRRGPVQGQVELEIIVRRDGSVGGVRVVGDTTGSFGLAPCVQGVVSGVRVGEPPASDTAVRHTVAFGR